MSNEHLVRTGKICGYCNKPPALVDSKVIYGKSYGPVWYCNPCNAYVGVHKGTKKPLGRLADSNLRYWKKQAHIWFDPLWKLKIKKSDMSKAQARQAAYAWLSQEMNLPKEYTHIGMMSIDECKKVVELCMPYYIKKTQD